MGIGTPGSVAGQPGQSHEAVLAARTDNAELAEGDVLQLNLAAGDGVSVIQPLLSKGLVRSFRGVTRHQIDDEAASDTGSQVTGRMQCKFKNHASAAIGSYATPVDGQDYLTYSPIRTNIILLTTQTTGTAVTGPSSGADAPEVFIMSPEPLEGATVVQQQWLSAAAAAEDGILSTVITGTTAAQTLTTEVFETPDFPRNVVLNPDGNTSDCAAGSFVVTGTNIFDEAITETITVTTNQAHDTLSAGAKAFKTLTQITVPAMDGAGVTFHLGTGDALGLNRMLGMNTVRMAALANVTEGTAPTVTVNSTAVDGNTIDLNSALDGNTVDAFYYDHL